MIGLRIRRVDTPAKELLAITLSGRERTEVFVYRSAGALRGAGLVSSRPKGAPADSFTQRLRKLLVGAAITDIGAGPGDRFWIQLARGGEECGLVLDTDSKHGRVWVLGPGRELVAARDGKTDGLAMRSVVPDALVATEGEVDLAALFARGEEIVVGARGESLAVRKRSLARALSRAIRRLERRMTKIRADAARGLDAGPHRARATAILSSLHAYVPGSAHLDVVDYGEDPPTRRRVPIDPGRGPRAEAEALYRLAKRLERGVEKAAERERTTEAELERIRAIAGRLEVCADPAEIDALAEEAARAGVRGARGASASKPKRTKATARRPYRRFGGFSGRAILVGRGASDNDALTLRHSKPSDLWLHARGHRGAHVVVPLGRKEECPPALLLDAATLAVHFSAAAGEDRVEVQHTPRRHVRKPRGAAPGAVMVDRERVLVLRHEPERLARLLSSEEFD